MITVHPYFIKYRVDNESQLPLGYIKKMSNKKTVERIRSDVSIGHIFFYSSFVVIIEDSRNYISNSYLDFWLYS